MTHQFRFPTVVPVPTAWPAATSQENRPQLELVEPAPPRRPDAPRTPGDSEPCDLRALGADDA